ncbi:MAG: hypothetical protein K0B08_09625 [Bacteroidales bacterium]|nr:hypothetical protein [Bacteroidales bacterium]
MKKIVILLSFLFAFSFGSKAQVQVDDDIVIFNAHLLENFTLWVDGEVQDIVFQFPVQYNEGVEEGTGITPGFTDLTVDATGDWRLTIGAPHFTPTGGGASEFIPIDNLAVWCSEAGTATFGVNVLCPYIDNETVLTMPLSPDSEILFDVGPNGNIGGNDANAFRLHWVMGTGQTGMNPLTMFQQLAAGDFTLGDYTTTATLTLFKMP